MNLRILSKETTRWMACLGVIPFLLPISRSDRESGNPRTAPASESAGRGGWRGLCLPGNPRVRQSTRHPVGKMGGGGELGETGGGGVGGNGERYQLGVWTEFQGGRLSENLRNGVLGSEHMRHLAA